MHQPRIDYGKRLEIESKKSGANKSHSRIRPLSKNASEIILPTKKPPVPRFSHPVKTKALVSVSEQTPTARKDYLQENRERRAVMLKLNSEPIMQTNAD
jgi:hypothetical protein